LQEVDKKLSLEKFENVNQVSKEKELEKKIKSNYQIWLNNKNKYNNLYVGPSLIHKYGVFTRVK
jgi:hypothetical protein